MALGGDQPIMIKKVIGAPTDLLQARIGTKVTRGQDALDQIRLIVTSQATGQAFETGQDEGVEIPGAKK